MAYLTEDVFGFSWTRWPVIFLAVWGFGAASVFAMKESLARRLHWTFRVPGWRDDLLVSLWVVVLLMAMVLVVNW
ncbi:hypothetical protein [Aestuariimicrobium ganziense]|uniref:hypothetical protein n=1 Tax=Aestuariimicrobium ganziense TaxID=2773677 RepID=UPI0019436344|nr:hypothetical protein [Aestuariimicrobium ganziense]